MTERELKDIFELGSVKKIISKIECLGYVDTEGKDDELGNYDFVPVYKNNYIHLKPIMMKNGKAVEGLISLYNGYEVIIFQTLEVECDKNEPFAEFNAKYGTIDLYAFGKKVE